MTLDDFEIIGEIPRIGYIEFNSNLSVIRKKEFFYLIKSLIEKTRSDEIKATIISKNLLAFENISNNCVKWSIASTGNLFIRLCDNREKSDQFFFNRIKCKIEDFLKIKENSLFRGVYHSINFNL